MERVPRMGDSAFDQHRHAFPSAPTKRKQVWKETGHPSAGLTCPVSVARRQAYGLEGAPVPRPGERCSESTQAHGRTWLPAGGASGPSFKARTPGLSDGVAVSGPRTGQGPSVPSSTCWSEDVA